MTDKDKTLEQIFGDFTPDLGNGDAFMARLDRKLDAVEFIKARQEKHLRHFCLALIGAFVFVVAVSGVMFSIILCEPPDLPTFSFGIESLPFLLLEENSRMLSLTGLAMLMSAGIIVIVNMWQELASMKDMHESGIKVGA